MPRKTPTRLNETAPLQYSNGKLIEKGAGGRSDRTEAAPQHKDWSFDEDNLLPPCLSKYEYASQVADLEIDGADEVEEINGLHEELPGNSKQKVSEEEVKLAWNTEASNGLTVSQRKNIKVVKDDADKDDVIKAPVQRQARANLPRQAQTDRSNDPGFESASCSSLHEVELARVERNDLPRRSSRPSPRRRISCSSPSGSSCSTVITRSSRPSTKPSTRS